MTVSYDSDSPHAGVIIGDVLMKTFPLILLALLCCLASARSAAAQSSSVKDSPAAANADAKNTAPVATEVNESRSAADLYEEANNYTRKKFAAFEKLKMPYDG